MIGNFWKMRTGQTRGERVDLGRRADGGRMGGGQADGRTARRMEADGRTSGQADKRIRADGARIGPTRG